MIQAGCPGSCHDWSVFGNNLFAKEPHRFLSDNEYILGDSGYPISKWLLAPYRNPRAAIPENARFNRHISTARVIIEHTNGVLKMRWGSLQGLRHVIRIKEDVQAVVDRIQCCITLHNIMAELNDGWDYLDAVQDNAVNPDRQWGRILREGEELRDRIKAFVLRDDDQ